MRLPEGARGAGETTVIPYRTFPEIHLGPVPLHTFGVFVALGILLGVELLARHGRRYSIPRDDLVRLGAWTMLLALLGSRVSFVLTHASEFADRPLAAFAVWEGGLQFSGGFVVAVPTVLWWFRRHPELPRWAVADGIALGLAAGVAVGRIGCYAVGEHLGGDTSFPLAVHYLGGVTREGPIAVGARIHNTSLYEFLLLLPLVVLLLWLRKRGARPGMMFATFAIWYAVQRFLTDFVRVYDRRVAGLTGAQWLCLALVLGGIAVFVRRRGARAAEEAGP